MERNSKEMVDKAHAIANKKNLTKYDIKQLLTTYRGLINKKYVANRIDLSDEIQIELASVQDYEIRKTIASRMDLCKEAFDILINDPVAEVVIALRNSKHVDESNYELIQSLIDNMLGSNKPQVKINERKPKRIRIQ